MKGKTLIFTALVWGGVLLMLPACASGASYSPDTSSQATAPVQPAAPAPGQTYAQMGGGMGGSMGGGMMGGQGYQGSQQQYQQRHQQRTGGAGLFAANCASCHPNGGNSIVPNMPLRGAPQLGSYSSFSAIVRQGRAPMPAFPPSSISDSQLRELYRYVRSTFGE